MKKRWWRNSKVIALALLAFWVSTGCQVPPGMSEDDSISAANEENNNSEREDSASQANSMSDVSMESAPAQAILVENSVDWPEGWMVVYQEEWIPVLDELGRSLSSARRAFQQGNRSATATEIRRGIHFLGAQVAESSERDRAALVSAIATLQAIADRLSGEDEVSLRQLDIAFSNAYRSDLERESFVVETDSTVSYLDRPGTHLDRAVEQFLANDAADAANEIDKASAYLRVESNRLGLAERAQLSKAAQDLEHLAARLRLQEIRESAELDSVFAPLRLQWRLLARTPARQRPAEESP